MSMPTLYIPKQGWGDESGKSHDERSAKYQATSYGCRTSSSYNSVGMSRTRVTAIPMTGCASSGGSVRRSFIGLMNENNKPISLRSMTSESIKGEREKVLDWGSRGV